MDQRDPDELLWLSCCFGMRVALQSLDTPDPLEKLKECVRLIQRDRMQRDGTPRAAWKRGSNAPRDRTYCRWCRRPGLHPG